MSSSCNWGRKCVMALLFLVFGVTMMVAQPGRGGKGNNASFTVRRESYGVGVERKFPLYTPAIEKIEKVRVGKVRRSKLFFLRALSGKKARIVEDLSANAKNSEDK